MVAAGSCVGSVPNNMMWANSDHNGSSGLNEKDYGAGSISDR